MEHVLRTGFPASRHVDRDFLLLYGCMFVVVDFINEECGGIENYKQDIVDFQEENAILYEKQIREMIEISEIYDWWVNSPRQDDPNDVMANGKDTEMLHRLMDVRDALRS